VLGAPWESSRPKGSRRSDTPITENHIKQTHRDLLRRIHPLLIVVVFIVTFLEIHPFQEGNWRLSRILTTFVFLQAGYTYVPYSSLESVIENSKEGYYLALRQTQGTIRS
jgi:Fic family protein